MDLSGISNGSKKRLERIKELKNCDDLTAIEFSLSAGWIAAEHYAQKSQKVFKGPAYDEPI